MGMKKNQFKWLILVFGVLISLLICGGASAAEVNNITHLSMTNELKSVHTNSSTVIKDDVKKTSATKYSNVTIITNYTKTTNLPAYYDLRKLGKLTPVKNQGFSGTCWAFAAIGSLESSLLPYETWNFSENNMKNLCSNTYYWGFDRGYNDAGCWEQATAYLTRYSGPVTSSQDPFNEFSGTSPTGLKVVKHVQETIIIGARNSTGKMDNSALKNAVMKYGAVYSLMTYDDSYLNLWTYGYYYNGSSDVNHGIDIVGWDDNYSKNNFLNGAPGNGAFIIRNSWGSDWGDNGYFYVSYYDKFLANSDDNVVFMDAEPTNNYDNIYQYDPFGDVGSYGYYSDVGWFSNVFTTKGNELLKASSFYVLSPYSSYDLYVYLDPKGGNPINGVLALTQHGIISTAGYKTIILDKFIQLLKGHKFSVVVKLTTPNNNEPITIEYPLSGYSSKATANPGESYVSIDGISWEDMTSVLSNANVCLKAFTSSQSADLSITKKISNQNPSLHSKVLFTITVRNNGPGTAVNVIVTDKLPLGLTFLSYITKYGNYDPKTGIWNIGTLPNGAVATIIIKCIVDTTSEFTNKAIVLSSTYDPILINNIATVNGNIANQSYETQKIQKLIPMQKTGPQVVPLIVALIIIIGGSITIRKN